MLRIQLAPFKAGARRTCSRSTLITTIFFHLLVKLTSRRSNLVAHFRGVTSSRVPVAFYSCLTLIPESWVFLWFAFYFR